ncbi:MAG: beta-ketoacyl synthase N-terminal-like domain-containing protein [Burkholderiaceae bacterium]
MSDKTPHGAVDTGTDIAVVGMAGRFPGARNIDEYWHNLRDGVESLTTFTEAELLAAGVAPEQLRDPNYVKSGAVLPDMEMFDAGFFGFSPREASIMDPQHRHFLECAWEALENAGHVPERFSGAIGVFGGSGHNAYMPYNLLTNPKLVSSVGFFLVRHTGNDKDFLTTRVSYLLNLTGPSVNVQTACSTSLVAIHMGCQSLLSGECDMALAGGVTIELPHRHGYLYQEGEILSPDGHCRAFDAASQGTVFGSAVGIVVLRRLADALADGDHIHAVIKGCAVNNDGAMKVGYLAPSVDGQANAIAEALAIANVPPETVTYVETHGTGTPVGDPIEIAALTQAFRQGTDRTGFCAVGSVKSNIGHTDTAAGVASFIKVALAMQHRELPASLHFHAPNPACDFERSPFRVNAALTPWAPSGMPRRAGVSSLGVGGTNAHVILEEAPPAEPSGASRSFQLLLLSAKTPKALEAGTSALAEHLEKHADLNFADIAYTLQVGRQPMKHRRCLVAHDLDDALTAIRAGDAQRITTTLAAEGTRSVVFMFAGGGAQYPGMGVDLYRSEPVYRKAVDECLAILARRLKTDFKGPMFPAVGDEGPAALQLERPSLALPALFTTQYALAKLWMSWGIEPAAMIGHSMGEYTAAHLAGVFSLADALALVELRGRLFGQLPEGAMLSVALSEAELRSLMAPQLSIAAVNGPNLTVASGPVQAIDALHELLQSREIESARVRIAVAAHSAMLDPILAEFGQCCSSITMQAPTRPFVSNLSGTWITPAEATDPRYWVRHLRSTVRFADGLQVLVQDPNRVLLEVGPGRTLASLARQHLGRPAQQPVFNSLRHPDEKVSDVAFVLGVLGRLWSVGVALDWEHFRGTERRKRVPLPTYRFDHQRHWIEPGKAAVSAPDADATEPLDKRADIAEWFYQPVWKRSLRPGAATQRPQAAALQRPPPEGVEETSGGRAFPQDNARALVFCDDCGLAERLIEQLRADGCEVCTVRAGESFARSGADDFTIDPGAAADYETLIATLNAEGRAPRNIFHLWSVTGSSVCTPGIAGANRFMRVGFYSLLHLAQAIGREDFGEPIRLGVVTDHAQRIALDGGVLPAKATVHGPCKVIPREFTNIRCCSIDVNLPPRGSRHEQRLVRDLIAEVSAPGGDEVLAYRASERWVQDYEPLRLELPAGKAPSLRTHGVYLITGGLGGVGLALAEHLVIEAKARLVLVARSSLPPREDWDSWLARNDPALPASRRMRHVMALEALGGEVLVACADVTDLAQMRGVIEQARSRFGAIHGVLHTAGVLDDGVIQLKRAEAAAAVLAPKVQGTLVLEEALGGAPLDFLVLFSSISSFAGLAGQVDYAAANAFLDCYAQERVARDGTFTVAVNWSQWQDVGMAAALAQQLGIGHGAGTPLGHPLVERCLKDAADERVYATQFSRRTHWLLDEHRVRGGDALIPGTGYLELVRAAFAHHGQPRVLEMRDVTFLAPFAVHADEQKELLIMIRRIDGAASQFALTSRVGGIASDEAGWSENVRGTVAYVDTGAPERQELARIAARCRVRSQVFDGSEKPAHLIFGPRWSNVKRIDFGQSEALVSLELPAPFAADLERFELHPALMDMATAGAQALMPNFDEGEDFFVPASYGVVRIFAPLTPKIFSHIRFRRDDGVAENLASYDVTVFDAAGTVLVDIAQFTMLRLRDKSLLAGAAAPSRVAALSQRPRVTANNVLSVGLRDGILSAEGADALERILSLQPGPQVVVSPQHLGRFMARLRTPAAPAITDHDHGAAGAAAAERGAGWKAPATPAEQLIAQMWGEMLGVEHVSATDDFFDLGGHSLLAVQVINKLRKRTGKSLPLTALLQAPTVETLAALIEPPAAVDHASPSGEPSPPGSLAAQPVPAVQMPASGSLIRIRTGGEKPAIFFVHDGNGETLLYRTLAYLLDPGHAVYGLQPATRGDSSYVHTRIRDMAFAHIEQMRAVQPKGPYLITGLCAGGVIGFEMARQLQDQGETTSFVGIIDAADVAAQERPFRLVQERLGRLMGVVSAHGDEPAFKRFGTAIPRIIKKTTNFARYQVESRLDTFRNTRKVKSLRGRDEQGADAPISTPDLSFLKLYEVAHREHVPTGVFSSGMVTLFRATKGDGSTADIPFAEIYTDADLGWSKRVLGDLRVVDVPGGHSSALQEPHVRMLAVAMQRSIDMAIAKAIDAAAVSAAGDHDPNPTPRSTATVE